MHTMKYLVLLALAISANGRSTFDDVLGEEWQLFKLEHSKVYENSFEENSRKKIYFQNKLMIINHNRLYELGQVSYKMGLNKYSDLTHQEFIARMNGGFNSSLINLNEFDSEAATFIVPDFYVPTSVDWRQKGAVTPVKDQGQCGSCWAFATTGTLEGQYFRKTGKLVSMSEQNLVDCSPKYGNHGCGGGVMVYAYRYIHDNGGIDTEASYPYEEVDNRPCRFNRKFNSGASVKAYANIPSGDEEALKKAVATVGPVAIAMDASPASFGHYKEGVYDERACSSTKLTHAVLIVGYGTTKNGVDYWIVKNSWGSSWGQQGYILMARNKSNQCGVATAASFPQV